MRWELTASASIMWMTSSGTNRAATISCIEVETCVSLTGICHTIAPIFTAPVMISTRPSATKASKADFCEERYFPVSFHFSLTRYFPRVGITKKELVPLLGAGHFDRTETHLCTSLCYDALNKFWILRGGPSHTSTRNRVILWSSIPLTKHILCRQYSYTYSGTNIPMFVQW